MHFYLRGLHTQYTRKTYRYWQIHMWTRHPSTLSTFSWSTWACRRTWESLGSFAHPHFRCGLIAHPRSCWKLPYSAAWMEGPRSPWWSLQIDRNCLSWHLVSRSRKATRHEIDAFSRTYKNIFPFYYYNETEKAEHVWLDSFTGNRTGVVLLNRKLEMVLYLLMHIL
jgi:hypothetical protein